MPHSIKHLDYFASIGIYSMQTIFGLYFQDGEGNTIQGITHD
jgi:hypothetical protein